MQLQKYCRNFDRHVTDVVAVKIIFDNNSIYVSLSLLWLPWHQFELDVWSWLLDSFRVRDKTYLSVGFTFRIWETSLIVLRGWQRFEPTSVRCGSAQNIELLHGFFARTELLALVGVDSLVLVGRKRDRGKTRTSSTVVVRNFAYCPSEPTAVEQFLHLFIGSLFLTVSCL